MTRGEPISADRAARNLIESYVQKDVAKTPFLSREQRKSLETTKDRRSQNLLHEYSESPYRLNKIGAALGAALVLYSDSEKYGKQIEDLLDMVLTSGANEGAPITQDQVKEIQSLLAEVLSSENI